MNYKSLDNYIRQYTNLEKSVRSGLPFHFDEPPREVTVGHRNVLSFENAASYNSHASLRVTFHPRFIHIPVHVHPWIKISYIYSGSCTHIFDQQTIKLQKDQVILIDSNEPHEMLPTSENDIMVNILIDKEYLNQNFFNRLSNDSILSRFFINAITDSQQKVHFLVLKSEKSRRIPLFIREFLCEFFDPSINSTDMLDSLLSLIVSELVNVLENDLYSSYQNSAAHKLLPVMRYIEGNYTSCTLNSTAAFFNLNPNYLTTLLKKYTGKSFKELILDQRMFQAAKLLKNTSLPVTQIAHEIGYENVSFFYLKFNERYKCNPQVYREQHRT